MNNFIITDQEKKFLLELARNTIDSRTNNAKFKKPELFSKTLEKSLGVFVTLHKQGHLRGCIGYVEGVKSLQESVIDMSIAAAFDDPRFPAVNASEMENIKIEISVLSILKVIKDVKEIVVGKHGLVIQRNFQRGLLLPQVATEYKWDRITFLEQTCEKAGLPSNAWKDPRTKIYIFSAEIFSENDNP